MTLTRVFEELYFYVLIFGGYVQGSVVALALGWALIGRLLLRTRRTWQTFTRILAFNVCLLLTGAIGSSLWSAVAYERWYFQADPVVTYQPIIPFGRYVLDFQFGSYRGGLLNGSSLLQIETLWWALSLFVWAGTIWLYLKVVRRWPDTTSMSRNAG